MSSAASASPTSVWPPRPGNKPAHSLMKPTDIEDQDEPGFFKRNLFMIILGGLALAGGGYFYLNHKPSKAAPKKKMDMVMVSIAMPPPIVTPDVNTAIASATRCGGKRSGIIE